MQYRKELDFLRGISIIFVFLFHLKIDVFNGGFLGVDIFFVISGYLIAYKSLISVKKKKFSIINFYERRIRRLLPALATTTFLVIFISLFTLNPDEISEISDSILSSSLFVSNYYFWKQSFYFEGLNNFKPMLHTWSLSVEEQFYIIFPLFIFIFLIKGKWTEKILYILISSFLIFLVLTVYFTYKSPNASFFFLPTRIFEILLGVIIAFIKLNETNYTKYTNKNMEIICLISMVTIILSILNFSKEYQHPGIYTLFVIFPTALIILFYNEDLKIKKIFQFEPIVGIGKLSYGLYLYHYPIISFFLFYGYKLNYVNNLLIAIFAFLIAYLSKTFIEKKFLNKKFLNSKTIFLLLFIYLIIIFFYFIIIKKTNITKNIFYAQLNTNEKILLNAVEETKKTNKYKNMLTDNNCKIWSKDLNKNFKNKINNCLSKNNNKSILIFGDSHAMDLYNSVFLTSKFDLIIGISNGGCRPIQLNKCDFYSDLDLFLKKNARKFDKILFTQKGSYFLKETKELDLKKIQLTSKFLKSISDKIIWVGPVYEHNIKINYELIKNFKKYKYTKNNLIYDIDKKISDNYDGIFISWLEQTNYNFYKDYYVNNNLTFDDESHLSFFGERYFGEKLMKNNNFN